MIRSTSRFGNFSPTLRSATLRMLMPCLIRTTPRCFGLLPETGRSLSHTTSTHTSSDHNDTLLGLVAKPPGSVKPAWPIYPVNGWLSSPGNCFGLELIRILFPHSMPRMSHIASHSIKLPDFSPLICHITPRKI